MYNGKIQRNAKYDEYKLIFKFKAFRFELFNLGANSDNVWMIPNIDFQLLKVQKLTNVLYISKCIYMVYKKEVYVCLEVIMPEIDLFS